MNADTNPTVSEDTRRVLQQMATELIELRERAERLEKRYATSIERGYALRLRLDEVWGQKQAAEVERDAALDLLRGCIDQPSLDVFEAAWNRGDGNATREWNAWQMRLRDARDFLSTRTPRPQDDPSGIALLGDPWEG